MKILILLILVIFISNNQVLSNNLTSGCEDTIRCHCDDLGPITGVVCDNVTDFAGPLSDGSLFEVNETYEITVTGVSFLPSKMLKDLIVYRLYIDDPQIAHASDEVFGGVYRLRRLHVRASSLQTIPDLSFVSHSLRNLNFDQSDLTSVQDELKNLPLLTEVTLRNNRIWNVSEKAFEGTTNLTIVDFSHNLLSSLPPDLFDGLSSLRKLVLSYNQLLHVDGLFKKVRPRFLYLQHNNLSEADAILHPNMSNLETLHLNYNPLRYVTESTFNGKISSVRFIYIDHCQIREFNVRHYEKLVNLTELDLSGNFIKKISSQTIAFGYQLDLELSDNEIESFEGEITYKVKRLYLSGNRLRLLEKTLQLTQMTEVEVNSNQLETILGSDLRGMHATENLSFRDNIISRLDSEAFRSLRNDLQNLDLSGNRLKSFNNSVRYLSQLKSLNASNNIIDRLEYGEFVGMNELSELFLQFNRIKILGGQMQALPQLQFLNVQFNNIGNIQTRQLPKSLRFLYLKGNPLECSCHLLPFLKWVEEGQDQKTDVALCRPSNTTSIRDERFSCPRRCECSCIHDADESYLSVECRSLNLTEIGRWLSPNRYWAKNATLSSTVSSFRPSLISHQNKDPRFSISDRVLSIDIENNSISTLIDWKPPPDLKKLFLARNFLQSLPMTILRLPSLRTVSLSHNPWSCNCSAVTFRKWLISKMEDIVDVNETRCGPDDERSELYHAVVVTLTDVDLCPYDIGFYVIVAFGILIFLLVCASLKIAYGRYEIHVKVWLYSHGVTWVKEKDIDVDKRFDAFISFSHKDESFVVNDIIEEIERRLPSIELCVHYRHFAPGEFIHVNIMNAVSSSKRTILVLSRNFLESEWCLMEFRAAHLQALEDRVHRLIVITVGDLPEEGLDPAIKVYLESTTYVTWGEKYFWKKLLYALPTRKSSCSSSQSYGSEMTLA